MRELLRTAVLVTMVCSGQLLADSAVSVLGEDYIFPAKIEGLPARISDFEGLQINSFQTSDGVKLSYWEAGEGEPLIFLPGWSAGGAEHINLMYMLSKKYHVFVLDHRNQGLSERVEYGTRISRFAVDLKEFSTHLGLESAYYSGWSMGAAIIWSYIDLFGTDSIRKAVFVDQPVSIYTHADWSEQERLEAGGMTTSAERMVAAFAQGEPTNNQVVDMKAMERYQEKSSDYFTNSESFTRKYIKSDPKYMSLVLFDHATNDWRDVLRHKIDIPVAIFSGVHSNNLPSQRWMASVIPDAKLHVYTDEEEGDHFLMFKNPEKFVADLDRFLTM